MPIRLLTTVFASLLLISGCNIIYKQNIQQGNALEQEDLDQLELGMSKSQVAFLLGTPAIRDPFHQDRWDYVSTFSRRGGEPVRRLVTLDFDNNNLTGMKGVKAGESEEVLTADGPEAITSPVATVGVNVEDARDYEDLQILRDGSPEWSVQLGSYSYRNAANRRLEELSAAGVDATIYGQVIGEVGFFIVRAGSYQTKQEAQAALRRLQEQNGVRGFLVSPGS